MSHEHPGHGHEGHEHHDHEHMSDEEMRARLEEELRRITVHDVLLQTVVTLVNLGGQRLGLTADTEEMRDLDQARVAIEGVRSLLPLLEERHAEQVRPIRDALSQLQMAYAQVAREAQAGAPAGGPEGEPVAVRVAGPAPATPPKRDAPAPGRPGGLWVPPGSDR
jgi:hypothetical protein